MDREAAGSCKVIAMIDGTGSQLRRVIEGQRRALELAAHGAPLSEVLSVVVRTIETLTSEEVLGSILILDDSGTRLLHGAAPSLPKAYNDAIHGIEIGPTVGSCGTAAFTRKPVFVKDITSDPLWASFKELAAEHGLRACWSIPVLSREGNVLATFAVYHRVVAEPTAEDLEVVELLGHTTGILLEQDRSTRRLRAQQEQRNAQMAALFEHAPAAIAVLRGPDHVFEVANARYTALLGGRALIGKGVREALPELEGQGLFELLDASYSSGAPYVGNATRVLFRRTPDGPLDEGFFDFVYQPIPGDDGKTDALLIVAFEVTELVRARLRAEESEELLKTFVDNLPELAWTALPDGHIDFYNRRWYEYTGTTFEEMQGWGWEKVHDPVLLPKVVERWKHSLTTGEPFEMEFTLRGSDGIPRWFLTRVAPVRNASGAITRWFGTNTNIDEIKASRALADAMAEQSRDTTEALLALRTAKEQAERRCAELEAQLRASSGGAQ